MYEFYFFFLVLFSPHSDVKIAQCCGVNVLHRDGVVRQATHSETKLGLSLNNLGFVGGWAL